MKKAVLIAGLLMTMIAVTACQDKDNKEDNSKDSGNSNKSITVDVDKLGSDIASKGKFNSEMTQVAQVMADTVLDISELKVTEETVYMGAGSSDLVAVFKAPDGKMKELRGKIDAYLEEQISQAKGYTPEQVDNLEDCVKRECGDYYIVVVSDDNDKAESIIDNNIK